MKAEFDRYAQDYDLQLEKGLRLSGEKAAYFSRSRIAWLAQCLKKLGINRRETVLDFGCGIGSATPHFFQCLGAKSVLGVDASPQSIAVAHRAHGSPRARFVTLEEYEPKEDCSLAFCNGVFHHIAPAERSSALRKIYRSLRPDALFAFWENNPWNPGTRLVMRRCPFDSAAVTLTSCAAKNMLARNGFVAVRLDYLFIFPRALGALRLLEPMVSAWPLGAQYQVLCWKES